MELIFWGILTVVLVIAEMITVQMIAVWCAAGAIVAFTLANLGFGLLIQLLGFVITSIILLLLTRPLVKHLSKKTVTPTNADSVIGMNCVVLTPINNLVGVGRVMVNGQSWSAKSNDDNVTFLENEACVITGIDGVKVIIKKP